MMGKEGTARRSIKGKYLVFCLLLPLAWRKFGGSREHLKLKTATENQIWVSLDALEYK